MNHKHNILDRLHKQRSSFIKKFKQLPTKVSISIEDEIDFEAVMHLLPKKAADAFFSGTHREVVTSIWGMSISWDAELTAIE